MTVNRVHITQARGEKRLCLRGAGGRWLRLARDGAAEPVEACPEYLGEDPLWRYTKQGDALAITAVESIGGVGVRGLERGRFTDDVVVGLPATGRSGRGPYYLLPTRAGVLHLSRGFRAEAIHAPPFPGLPGETPPRVLYMLDDDPIYAGRGAFRRLDDTREPAEALRFVSLEEAPLYAMEDGPGDSIRIRRRSGGEPGWLFMEPGRRGVSENRLPIDLSGMDKFDERRMAWNNPAPVMELVFGPGEITAAGAGPGGFVSIDLPSDLGLIAPIIADDRLLLIGRTDLLEVSLETAMVRTFEAPGSTPRRTRPPLPPETRPARESERQTKPDPSPALVSSPAFKPSAARELLDSDGDGVDDASDICLGTPDGVETDPSGCMLLVDIRFPTGRMVVQKGYHMLLEGVVDALNKNPGLTLRIHGHADPSGTEEENIRISRKRAAAVMNYLLKKGVGKERLEVEGRGSSSPKFSNETEEGRAKNRRVELTFTR